MRKLADGPQGWGVDNRKPTARRAKLLGAAVCLGVFGAAGSASVAKADPVADALAKAKSAEANARGGASSAIANVGAVEQQARASVAQTVQQTQATAAGKAQQVAAQALNAARSSGQAGSSKSVSQIVSDAGKAGNKASQTASSPGASRAAEIANAVAPGKSGDIAKAMAMLPKNASTRTAEVIEKANTKLNSGSQMGDVLDTMNAAIKENPGAAREISDYYISAATGKESDAERKYRREGEKASREYEQDLKDYNREVERYEAAVARQEQLNRGTQIPIPANLPAGARKHLEDAQTQSDYLNVGMQWVRAEGVAPAEKTAMVKQAAEAAHAVTPRRFIRDRDYCGTSRPDNPGQGSCIGQLRAYQDWQLNYGSGPERDRVVAEVSHSNSQGRSAIPASRGSNSNSTTGAQQSGGGGRTQQAQGAGSTQPVAEYDKAALVKLAADAGFPDPNLAAAVAMAESAGNPNALGDQGSGGSVGLWQVHRRSHPQYSDATLYDPAGNASAALQISGGGTNWRPWSAYNNGSYRKFL